MLKECVSLSLLKISLKPLPYMKSGAFLTLRLVLSLQQYLLYTALSLTWTPYAEIHLLYDEDAFVGNCLE